MLTETPSCLQGELQPVPLIIILFTTLSGYVIVIVPPSPLSSMSSSPVSLYDPSLIARQTNIIQETFQWPYLQKLETAFTEPVMSEARRT